MPLFFIVRFLYTVNKSLLFNREKQCGKAPEKQQGRLAVNSTHRL
jgi:hypothetical protein